MPKNTSPVSPEQFRQLEEQLIFEKQRSHMQLDEISRMSELVQQLETMVDKNVSVTESEHERIAMLEEAMGQQQTGTEEKVAKLLLAVAVEKRRADLAEQERLHQEQKYQAVVEELNQHLEAVRATSLSPAVDRPENWDNLEQQLLAECALRDQAEQRVVGLEQQVKTMQQMVEKLTTEAVERQRAETELLTKKDFVGAEAIAELMGQYQSEMVKRMDAQNKVLQKDQQVRELQRQVDALQNSSGVTSMSPSCDQERLVAQEAEKQRLELAEKESQLQKLQQQLADELAKRASLHGQVAEKDKQLRDMQSMLQDQHPTAQEQLLQERHDTTQEQLLQRTKELCDLQAQLVQELTVRQDVQYKVLDLQRVNCDLQRQLTSIAARPIARGVGDGSSASPSEPEGEDSTCPTGETPHVQQVVSMPIGAFGPPNTFGALRSTPTSFPGSPTTVMRTTRRPASFDSSAFMPQSSRTTFPIFTMPRNSPTSMEQLAGSSPGVATSQHNMAW